jgi:dienelactone hydrolase
MRTARSLCWLNVIFFMLSLAQADDRLLHIDWSLPLDDVKFHSGAETEVESGRHVLAFTNPLQYAELPYANQLDGVKAASVCLWVKPKRAGEQAFVARGLPKWGANGERMFPPHDDWVSFLLGTDQRGFFLGTIHGNGKMPFPLVSLDEVPIDQWSWLVAVKTAEGYHKLYRNGVLVLQDKDSAWAPVVRPFGDGAAGEPLRLMMPLGGWLGEVSIYGRELSNEEIASEFAEKKENYQPAIAPKRVWLREMNAHPDGAWEKRGQPLTTKSWPSHRARILRGVDEIFGKPPALAATTPLDPQTHGEVDCGSYVRRKLSIQVQPSDRMPFYLLLPKQRREKTPAIICFYGTTSGAGKETTVGLSGGKPGSPLEKNRGFAVDFAEAGFLAVAADYLRDGERIKPGRRPYDTTDFYEEFPDWSIHRKDAFDTSRLIDYLQTLDFVSAEQIGMVGHSYGGHSAIFTTALEPRIKAAWANGPVSDFRHHGMHWAVPKGGGASQSLPALRPYLLDHTKTIPLEFFEITALIAPRPLVVGQAVGEHRPREEENYAAVKSVYEVLEAPNRVKYWWYAGDHDFPPEARAEAVRFFQKWFSD